MKTKIIINNEINLTTVDRLSQGTWFKRPDSGQILIKGDNTDTVYEGRKHLCMSVSPTCGIIVRVDIREHVEVINTVNITY